MSNDFTLEYAFSVSPEQVFCALTDVSEQRQWLPGLTECVPLDNENAAETALKYVRKLDGRESAEVVHVKESTPHHTYAISLTSRVGSSQNTVSYRYTLDATDDGCRLAITCIVHTAPSTSTWAVDMLSTMLKGRLESDCQALMNYVGSIGG